MIDVPIYKRIKDDGRYTTFTFQPLKDGERTPGEAKSVISFVFVGDSLVLILNKDGKWDVVGGKIDKDETWRSAIIRESYEEAGIRIDPDNMREVGYVVCVNSAQVEGDLFPKESTMPVIVSFVEFVEKDTDWQKRETSDRCLFSLKKGKKRLEGRNDNDQLLCILKYVESWLTEHSFVPSFKYIHEESLSKDDLGAVVTQCMCLSRNKKDEYCVVRDHDENYHSLPGGGCELGEDSLVCAKRELEEEAQMTASDYKLLGKVMVAFSLNGKIVTKVAHDRYLSSSKDIKEFIPRKDGFETVERSFVPLSELQKNVMLLQNPSGDAIIEQLKSL